MKRKSFLLFAIILLVAITSLVGGCNKKQEETSFLTVDMIDGLEEVQKDGTLFFEWLNVYDPSKPTLFVFHGEENAESHFTVDLDRSVYTSDIMAEGVGGDFGMRTHTAGAYFDMNYFWFNIARYNVSVFHWERFSAEADADSVITKIFSSYKSRYTVGQTVKENVFSVPLADVVFALYLSEAEKVSLSKKEIRFVGAGTGALLAEAVATKTILNGKKDICPYRVALCDPPLSTEFVTFETPWLSASASQGTIGLVSAMNKQLIKMGAALELYETKEVGATPSYAYNYGKGSREEAFRELKKDFCCLEIAESYSLSPLFDVYKTHKRLALDWYIYSVIGSDDGTVGCGTIYTEQDLSVNNRGSNNTRPILNERLISNSDPSKRGRNYGLSSWTPTTYVRALRGVSFTQKTSAVQDGYDVQGKEIYVYKKEYVLERFSSENYQVSDMKNYSLLCGYVYFDKNENDRIDDGAGLGRGDAELSLDLYLVTETDEVKIFERQSVYAGDDGFFVIRFMDATAEDEAIRIKSEKGLFTVSGVKCKDQSVEAKLSYKYPVGISSYYGKSVGGLFYSTMDGNSFAKNTCTAYVTKDNVHGVIIANCLYIEVK